MKNNKLINITTGIFIFIILNPKIITSIFNFFKDFLSKGKKIIIPISSWGLKLIFNICLFFLDPHYFHIGHITITYNYLYISLFLFLAYLIFKLKTKKYKTTTNNKTKHDVNSTIYVPVTLLLGLILIIRNQLNFLGMHKNTLLIIRLLTGIQVNWITALFIFKFIPSLSLYLHKVNNYLMQIILFIIICFWNLSTLLTILLSITIHVESQSDEVFIPRVIIAVAIYTISATFFNFVLLKKIYNFFNTPLCFCTLSPININVFKSVLETAISLVTFLTLLSTLLNLSLTTTILHLKNQHNISKIEPLIKPLSDSMSSIALNIIIIFVPLVAFLGAVKIYESSYNSK